MNLPTSALFRDTSAQDRVMAPSAGSRARPVVLVVAGLVALIAIGVAAPSIARWFGATHAVSASRLRIAAVHRGDLVRDVSAQGRVVAAVSPTLYAPAAGTVDLKINAGEKVERNQVLAEVDSPELRNKLDQERATLQSLQGDVERGAIDTRKKLLEKQKIVEQAEVDLTAAQREVDRNQQAYDKGAIAEMVVLRAKDGVTKAALSLNQARQDVALEKDSLAFEQKTKGLARDRQRLVARELERQVDALKIRAPVSGQVGTLLIAQRANVAANAPILTVVDLTALEIEIQVPETFAHDLAIGMGAEIANGSERYAGALSAVSPEVVNSQVVARVRFKDTRPEGLRQNQRLSTRILLDQHPNVLLVERGPFVDSGAGRMAYIVRGDYAERQPIEVGATSLNAVEILSGLKEGDRIVISGTDEFGGAERVLVTR